MAAIFTDSGDAVEEILKSKPSIFLTPEDSTSTRGASASLFSSLATCCSKLPVYSLLAEQHFDAEQIWSQIDLVYRPVHSSIRHKVKQLEHVAPEPEVKEKGGDECEMDDGDREDAENNDDDEEEEEEEEEEDEEEEEEGDEKDSWKGNGVEDEFLKINELEEYLEEDEAREYGFERKEGKTKRSAAVMDEDDEEGDEDDEELDLDIGDDEDAGDERYEDFFGGETKKFGKRKGGIKEKKVLDGSEDPLSNENENNGMYIDTQDGGALSTHEKELLKMQSKIHELEKANLDPKLWTMQGEVTATKRPKNSALEVDLDFEHNVRPPPVITEEVTASIEDLIKKRIIEGHFDDVQRAPDLPLRAPKKFTEMDETKSKKGLAEIYEEEYAQKTGLSTAPLSSSDEKKKEASLLFKRLCLKLDALAHFHFAPKPVIEEMSIHANIPALAMEEIAPVAVSDAAMLAPEEVFQGKGDLKEQAELTQSERKRKRANKKRRFKANQIERDAKKVRQKPKHDLQNGKEDS